MTKKASECKSLEEVRVEIDRIDKEIISLFGKRFDYVKEVVKYRNPDKPEVPDRNRFEQVIHQRGLWAAEQGLETASIEKVYRELIEYYIREQAELAKELK
jgi:isochorismate pyruvate lyase